MIWCTIYENVLRPSVQAYFNVLGPHDVIIMRRYEGGEEE